ncbi:coniferyl-alcohol dehydrogenase [Streptomyces himalayensis]|uniref:Coniferyl-alcohol dehydrogenase n=1 Tax=Streptomyces himalayensis subsp. himalayensis TaxID=2756131 RepID=A0A7W0DKI3_9ACTN|nr:coniferyl-alcohol dehydrogenase [Streptomyces himalayensis]MBA2946756.1 coniferyl-alcohol dehydrogenase [Streptomyces himalayensis subsp. himalayensis]
MAKPRTVVVTGGASGIGEAVVQRFVARGDAVVILDRRPSDLPVRHIETDLNDRASIEAAVGGLRHPVDVLCNVAGVSGSSPVPLVLGVNFFGLRHLTEQLVPRMNAGGAVVSVASTAGWYWRDHLEEVAKLVSAPDFEAGVKTGAACLDTGKDAYTRSKEALIVWTSQAAQRYRGHVRVNTVSPGPVETPLLPEFYDSMGHAELDPLTELAGGRNGRPEEIAAVVEFLAGEGASWINGTDVVVDAGAEVAFELAQAEAV